MKTATPLTTIRFGEISSLLLITLSITALIVGIAMPAVAGSGGFNSTGSMNVARVNHTATLLPNGEVLVAGGDNGISGSLASTELYNPSTGKWTLTGSMQTGRWSHQAVRLQDGRVLGGRGFRYER